VRLTANEVFPKGNRRFKSSRLRYGNKTKLFWGFMLQVSYDNLPQSLVTELERLGGDKLTLVSDISDSDVHISIDPRLRSRNDNKTIAIYSEPRSIRPDLYKKSRRKNFLGEIANSPERATKLGLVNWIPLPTLSIKAGVWPTSRIPRSCMVVGHKFSASKDSNYALRRKVIKLDEGKDNKIDVYGVDWLDPLWLQAQRRIHAARVQLKDVAKFSIRELTSEYFLAPCNYKGVMKSDLSTISKYETAVIIENESDYISEKVWNCLAWGTVPIYVGPKLNDFALLKSLVIEVEPDPQTITKLVSKVSAKEIGKKRERIRKLRDEITIERECEQAATRLIQLILEITSK
jgi:hypothetical protein